MKKTTLFLFLVYLTVGPVKLVAQVPSVRIKCASSLGTVATRASEILAREISERSETKVFFKGKTALTIELAVKPGMGVEGFAITGNKKSLVKITGNDENGLLYGVGKFLHTSCFNRNGFTPSSWRGIEVPEGTLRGIYFATHFNNWYEGASNEERKYYLESLSLWGINALEIHFPNQWYSGYDDPRAVEWFEKFMPLLTEAKKLGMKVGLSVCPNTGFTSTPKEFLATLSPKFYGDVLVCPSKPAARKMLLDDWRQLLEKMKKTGLDFVVYWPYDEGGCACEHCMPWGSNGYPEICREYTKTMQTLFPAAVAAISTWMFDTGDDKGDGRPIVALKTNGEYAGLDRFLENDKSWVNYVMSDAHENFPPYLLEVRVPGNLPLLNFPEISMYGQWPCWGGYGATPLVGRLQKQWDETRGMVTGGFPYSEGIYEDMNKVICSQFYWNRKKTARETLEQYIAYEFSPDVVDSVMEAMDILEQNHVKVMLIEKKVHPSGNYFLFGYYKEGCRITFGRDMQLVRQTSQRAENLLKQAERLLPSRVKESWRWRIWMLRAGIDKELAVRNGWFEGQALQKAFAELTRLYHGEKGCIMLHVPVIEDANAKFSDESI